MAMRFSGLFLKLIERMSKPHKQAVFLFADVMLAALSLGTTLFFVFPDIPSPAVIQTALEGCLVVMAITMVASLALGVPKIKLKSYEVLGAAKGALVAMSAAVGLVWLQRGAQFALPGPAIPSFFMIFLLLMVTSRMAMLHLYLAILRIGKIRRNVIIYGAGNTGSQLAAALRGHETIRVVAFVDDSPKLEDMTVQGFKVFRPDVIDWLVTRHKVERVLLAIPSAPSARQTAIARSLMARGLEVQSLPSFAQLVGAEGLVSTLEAVAAGAFLGRAPHCDLQPLVGQAYGGKSIMVTGAGGSVGSELCRQLLRYKPARIVLFDLSEIALYTIDRNLAGLSDAEGVQISAVLGSVTDTRLIRDVIAHNRVDVILHAAAYKHVPLVEANPIAGLENNVLGTRSIAEAALHAGVRRFVLISTDKAVRPTNVMGASKRMAELVVQDMANRSIHTDFSIVRFGNVLGSSGSVVPLFKEQISRGGPVTLTHEDVTRYFMTISEAASLVLIAGGLSNVRKTPRSNLFVLDMGAPVRIRDLAERMIKTAGCTLRNADNPDGDIEIVVTGLRPGEKMHEELLIAPGMLTTPHEKIMRVQEEGLTPLQMAAALRDLRKAVAAGDAGPALSILEAYVEGYRAHGFPLAPLTHTDARCRATGSGLLANHERRAEIPVVVLLGG